MHTPRALQSTAAEQFDARVGTSANTRRTTSASMRAGMVLRLLGRLHAAHGWAWLDESKTKVGYEINFNRYFYKYTPPRPLEEIETDLKNIERDIADMLAEVTE